MRDPRLGRDILVLRAADRRDDRLNVPGRIPERAVVIQRKLEEPVAKEDDLLGPVQDAKIGRQADLDFHTTLLDATDNPFIISLSNGVSAAIRTTTIFKQRKHPLRRDPLPDHERVFEAIAAKDSRKAQEAMSELIVLARMDTPTARGSVRKRA